MDDSVIQQTPARDAKSIDSEHVIQLGMLEALSDAVSDKQPVSKVHEILTQLISYSEAHFMSEELLMRMYAYPDYQDHVSDHEAMIERLSQILLQFAEGQDALVSTTIKEMRDFLLGHINSRDQALSEYLSQINDYKK